VNPRVRRQFESRSMRAAMSGTVAAMAGASGCGAWVWRGEEKRLRAPEREGGPFLMGRAAELATCCAERGFQSFFLLPPEPEPEVA